MKKLLFGFIMLAATAASAQELAIGIKAGPNFAKIDASQSAGANYKNRTGFHAGAFVLIKVSKIGIQPEILFSQQGSKFKYSGSPDLESNFSYVNVPIIIKLYTVAGINLQVGPQFGFLTKAEQDFYDQATGIKTTADFKDAAKKTDISAALGLGWDLPFGLTIDARYNLGLTKINDQGSGSIKNQVIQVSLGYKLIKLGKS